MLQTGPAFFRDSNKEKSPCVLTTRGVPLLHFSSFSKFHFEAAFTVNNECNLK